MINTIDGIIAAAKGGKTGVIAVAAAHDHSCYRGCGRGPQGGYCHAHSCGT